MLELRVNNGIEPVVLQFEHSLLSLSKWESKYKKPFLTREKLHTEMLDYFQDMLVSPGVDRDLVYLLSPSQMDDLTKYINDVPSASGSNLPEEKKGRQVEVMTSELIYAYLAMMEIPFQPTETWHLNRVMMLIRIIDYKRQPPKKRKASEVMTDWRAENARRKKLYGISG